jgi:transcriptional regulator with XRE-family HTH domain
MTINYAEISKKTGVSLVHISLCAAGKRRPSWNLTKKISEITGIPPELIIETPTILKQFNSRVTQCKEDI